MKRIESAANPQFRNLLGLAASARDRRKLGLSVIEGAHLLDAYLTRHGRPVELFVPEHPSAEVSALVARAGVAPTVLAGRLFAQASQVENGPGPIAIVHTPRPELPMRFDSDAVYLDRVQDPGNVGSVLRTCAAVGVRCVIASHGTAFCWSPKVLRAAMGAHFHLDIHEGIEPEELLGRLAVEAMATTADAPADLYATDLRAPRVWLLGNEGQGLDGALLTARGVRRVSIPQSDAVESLNVGVAAAVCLYEQLRQRRAAESGQSSPRDRRA